MEDLSTEKMLWHFEHFNKSLKYNFDNLQKFYIHQNPFNSMTYIWNINQASKNITDSLSIPFMLVNEFWNTWLEVYQPKGYKCAK